MRSFILATTACLCLSQTADAAVVLNTWEEGGDLLFQYSGTLDTTGITFGSFTADVMQIVPSSDIFANVNGTFNYTSSAPFVSVVGAAGSGTNTEFTSFSGDVFGISSVELGVASGFVAGDSISGSATIAGATLASVGLNVGEVVYTLPSTDTITWSIGTAPAPIPLPAGLPLMLAGLGALSLVKRKRR